ncbi:MAG TPA: hypothetical protein VEG38_15980 [Acidimicrobiia bacterium]|nr:hypothetical protein [Acidimicrobiia bacterium]
MFHHALCITDDGPGVAAALAAISPATFRALLGDDATGLVEIAPLPEELNGRLVPGTTSISFAVDDLDERVAACRAAGLAVTVVPGALPYAVITVGGLEIELVRFAL